MGRRHLTYELHSSTASHGVLAAGVHDDSQEHGSTLAGRGGEDLGVGDRQRRSSDLVSQYHASMWPAWKRSWRSRGSLGVIWMRLQVFATLSRVLGFGLRM